MSTEEETKKVAREWLKNCNMVRGEYGSLDAVDEDDVEALAKLMLDRERKLIEERDHYMSRVKDLQETGTRLVEEKRMVDRRSQILSFMHASGGPGVRGGQHYEEKPTIPPEDVVRFRARLVVEEVIEWLTATFKITDRFRINVLQRTLHHVVETAPIDVNMPEFADAIGDIEYVLAGAAVAFGINMAPIAWAIHTANMAKAGGPRRESDGKLLKPPGWQPPPVADLLRAQGWSP